MSKTIVFIKRYHELKMGHFGEIRLADPVFSAVVLPTVSRRVGAVFSPEMLPAGAVKGLN